MKVILLKDVARMGRRGEIKELPSGHALNFLIPRKLAVPATPENLKRQQALITKHKETAEASQASFKDALAMLATTPVELAATANAKGHLFKGIKATDISERLLELGFHISPESIHLTEPLKAVGTHEVPLVAGKEKGSFTLTIIQK